MTDQQITRNIAELSSLDDFLAEDGILADVTIRAVKRVIAFQLETAMKERRLSKAAMAQMMDTSRAQLARVLDPDAFSITLDTLNLAAQAVGMTLKVELV